MRTLRASLSSAWEIVPELSVSKCWKARYMFSSICIGNPVTQQRSSARPWLLEYGHLCKETAEGLCDITQRRHSTGGT